jgi:hypothetical protein
MSHIIIIRRFCCCRGIAQKHHNRAPQNRSIFYLLETILTVRVVPTAACYCYSAVSPTITLPTNPTATCYCYSAVSPTITLPTKMVFLFLFSFSEKRSRPPSPPTSNLLDVERQIDVERQNSIDTDISYLISEDSELASLKLASQSSGDSTTESMLIAKHGREDKESLISDVPLLEPKEVSTGCLWGLRFNHRMFLQKLRFLKIALSLKWLHSRQEKENQERYLSLDRFRKSSLPFLNGPPLKYGLLNKSNRNEEKKDNKISLGMLGTAISVSADQSIEVCAVRQPLVYIDSSDERYYYGCSSSELSTIDEESTQGSSLHSAQNMTAFTPLPRLLSDDQDSISLQPLDDDITLLPDDPLFLFDDDKKQKLEKLAEYLRRDTAAVYDYSTISQMSSSEVPSIQEEDEDAWNQLWEMLPSMPHDPVSQVSRYGGMTPRSRSEVDNDVVAKLWPVANSSPNKAVSSYPVDRLSRLRQALHSPAAKVFTEDSTTSTQSTSLNSVEPEELRSNCRVVTRDIRSNHLPSMLSITKDTHKQYYQLSN